MEPTVTESTTTAQSIQTMAEAIPAPIESDRDNGPIPMSFPAILRAPGMADRFAHLRLPAERSSSAAPSAPSRKSKREEKEGKRWIRRKENARFVGNPHIVMASKKDFAIPSPTAQSTFPHPLPSYLSRNSVIPPAEPTSTELNSAKAGHFSLSMKGMRRELKKCGPHTRELVKEVEDEIMGWLHSSTWLYPDVPLSHHSEDLSPIGTLGSIFEVSRSSQQLVWSITDDSFARYVVHCCARYHNIVSFSKDTSGVRLTYILRPNVTRPDYHAPRGLYTPPITDLESSVDPESDFVFSDRDSRSDVDTGVESELEGAPPPGALSDIAESLPGSPALAAVPDGSWSVMEESDVENGYEQDGHEVDLASSVGSLDLHDQPAPLETRFRQMSLRPHIWDRNRRSASSPSRSPARRNPPRVFTRVEPPVTVVAHRSFFEYLYA